MNSAKLSSQSKNNGHPWSLYCGIIGGGGLLASLIFVGTKYYYPSLKRRLDHDYLKGWRGRKGGLSDIARGGGHCDDVKISSGGGRTEEQADPKSRELIEALSDPKKLIPIQTDSTKAWIKRIALIGGSCAGKTTALSRVSAKLRSLGIIVYCIPEAATMLFTSGCPHPTAGDAEMKLCWQTTKMLLQERLEDSFSKMAEKVVSTGRSVVILCDRGMVDSKAYVDSHDFAEILAKNRWTEEKLKSRYDCVLHLATAAIGAASFFSKTSNKARREGFDEAVALESRLRQAWLGHSRKYIIENHNVSFEDKMDIVVELVKREIGIISVMKERLQNFGAFFEVGGEDEELSLSGNDGRDEGDGVFLRTKKKRVFILEGELPNLRCIYGNIHVSELTNTWLYGSSSDGIDRVLLRKTEGDFSIHILCTRDISPENGNKKQSAGSIYLQNRISSRLYEDLVKFEKDPMLASLKRTRHCFIDTFGSSEAFFNLDIFQNGLMRLQIDHAEILESVGRLGENSRLSKMRWTEVTDSHEFSLRNIARKQVLDSTK